MIKFERHPEIALNADEFRSGKFRTYYSKDYDAIFAAVASGQLTERDVLRSLFANDLWFLVNFGMDILDNAANHPFIVDRCRMVETGPRTDTLDIWARYHWKSTIISAGETLQYHIKNPEHCTGLFAYNRPAAKKPLKAIKRLCENSDLLKWCFPEIFWKKPETEAPKWSEDEGIVFKRQSSSRPQSTIEAWGLTEGMPTGSHFERLIFDDLETEDIRESPDMLNKVFNNFMMAHGNLGMGKDTDIVRVIGTYYSYFGPNVKIRDLAYANGEKIYKLRLIPATHDGTRAGIPVYMGQKPFEKEKMGPHFNSQQLCDPTPSSSIKLHKEYLKPINRRFLPKGMLKFMVLDQAGGDATEKVSSDLWSYGCIGIRPYVDNIGQSDVYILDAEADQMSHAEGIHGFVDMYLRNGIIQQVGVEKVGLATTEMHIASALKRYGVRLEVENENLVLLKPANRSKERRVEAALQWPLNNGKIFYVDDLPPKFLTQLCDEMDKFPFFHVDILDMIAYSYDLFTQFKYFFRAEIEEGDAQLARAMQIIESENRQKKVSPLYHGLRVAQ